MYHHIDPSFLFSSFSLSLDQQQEGGDNGDDTVFSNDGNEVGNTNLSPRTTAYRSATTLMEDDLQKAKPISFWIPLSDNQNKTTTVLHNKDNNSSSSRNTSGNATEERNQLLMDFIESTETEW